MSNGLNRRGFIKASGLVALSTAFLNTNLFAHSHHDHGNSSNMTNSTNVGDMIKDGKMKFVKSSQKRALIYFMVDDGFDILQAACERLYPADPENGTPGANDLAIPYFIDGQLAGEYGNQTREYTQGPFFEGVWEQGYQTPIRRNQLFKIGLKALDDQANKNYKKPFIDLSGEQQDEILILCEEGKIEMKGPSSSYFFTLLKQATFAGAYSDPVYNGNDNKNGWRTIQYPGPVMSYISDIADTKFYSAEPTSLADM